MNGAHQKQTRDAMVNQVEVAITFLGKEANWEGPNSKTYHRSLRES